MLLGPDWLPDVDTLLAVETDGRWTLRVEPLDAAPELRGTAAAAE